MRKNSWAEATLAGIQVFNWSKARRRKDQRGESDQKQWELQGWNEVTTGSYAEEARRDKWVAQTDSGKYEQANQPLVAHHLFSLFKFKLVVLTLS